ncbi:MAG: ferrous iron transport protein B [Deltaproteobacteria bacterium]|jgi:ferrous iron transport protein B|nr:ferrous iron transport protein B [Deltaproteobacteria bacterium]
MSAATFALAGNPNSGKTTLFNSLTGGNQHVGNYPGVTVEKKEGFCLYKGRKFKFVDIPGTYSLTAYSLEEKVARDFLVNEKPAAVIDIIDASNLERNLYLTLQFMEMGVPVVLALNMIDVAKKRGITINTEKLSHLLGVPVVTTVARRGEGKEELLAIVGQTLDRHIAPQKLNISYGHDIDEALKEMEQAINASSFLTETYKARWTALKYLENDQQVKYLGRQEDAALSEKLEGTVQKVTDHLNATLGCYPEALIADHRYGFIKSILQQDVLTVKYDQNRLYLSDKIDKVLTNRFVGPLVMLAVIWGLYQFTFTYSEMPVGWFESFFGWLGGVADTYLPDGMVKSLVISGIIDGVGGVLGFVPLIMFMFFGIAFIEDSGYMARMAFMLDRIFRIFGLHGSSVMPFIVSGGIAGGCAVPGVMATRTLKSPRERLATLLTVPFMNCGAKLPVFALLVAAFFSTKKALVMFLITIGAWVGALLVARLLRSTVIKGESTPFVMELPPYRMPTLKGMFIHTWNRTWQYIKKAGTVILGISIVLWAFMTFPGLPDTKVASYDAQRQALFNANPAISAELESARAGAALSTGASHLQEKLDALGAAEAQEALQYSFAGRLGRALEPVSRFAGFDWRTNIALVGGFAAKEVVVSTLGTAYSLGDIDSAATDSLGKKLAASPHWRPLTAAALIIFIMFYSPCFVTVVCIAREAGSWKWGLFAMIFNSLLALLLAVTVFQAGRLLGF